MDTKTATIPVSTVAKVIKKYALHATSANERHLMYALTEQLGGEINQATPGFSETEFLNQCGVKPEWAHEAA